MYRKYSLQRLSVVAFVMVVALILIPFTAVHSQAVFATGDSSSQTDLDALVESIEAVNEAIFNSPDLTTEQRLDLLTQLLTLSQAILAVEDATSGSAGTGGDIVDADSEFDDSDLPERVYVTVDSEEYEAVVEVVKGGSTATYEYVLVDKDIDDDEDEIDDLLEQVFDQLSTELSLSPEGLESVSLNTVDGYIDYDIIPINSEEAIETARRFGVFSLVTYVRVTPGNGVLEVEIRTDQEEVFEGSLTLNPLSVMMGDPNYQYSFSVSKPSGPIGMVFPYVADSGTISRDEAEDFIGRALGRHPLIDTLADAKASIFNFLAGNQTFYSEPSGMGVAGSQPMVGDGSPLKDCYTEFDKSIVNEFVRFLLLDNELQSYDAEKIVHYNAPTRQDSFVPGCASVQSMFGGDDEIEADTTSDFLEDAFN